MSESRLRKLIGSYFKVVCFNDIYTMISMRTIAPQVKKIILTNHAMPQIASFVQS